MERRAWGLLGLFLVIYVLTLRGHLGSRDEEALYMTTVMLEKGGESALGLTWTAPEPGDVRTPLFSSYEIGQPLLAIPFYLAGDRLATLCPPPIHTYLTRLVLTLFDVLVTAATVALLYQLGRVAGYGRRAATLTAAAYGLGTLAWPYSRTFFRDPLVGLALLGAVLALAGWRTRGGSRLAVVAGGWVLIAVAAKFTSLIAVPVLLAYALSGPVTRSWIRAHHGGTEARRAVRGLPFSVGDGRSSLAAAVMVLGVGVILVLVLGVGALGVAAKWEELRGQYYAVLGALQGQGTLDFVGRAAYGLTLSPGKGLVEFAPPVLAGLAGLPGLARGQRATALLCGGLPAIYLVLYSFDKGWHGGACWGPRYLLPVLPLLLLPLGAGAAALWGRRARLAGRVGLGLLGGLLLVGGVVQGAGLAIDPIHYYLDVLRTHALTLESGPDYLQEIHFDPALSPIPGHLALAVRHLGDLAAGRTNFYPVPYEPVSYWQYFQSLAAPDFAAVDVYGWTHPGGYVAALNHPRGVAVVADAAAGTGRATQGAPGAPAVLLGTPPDLFPGGRYHVWLRVRRTVAAPRAALLRLAVQRGEAVQVVDTLVAASLPADGTYGLWRAEVALTYGPPVSFAVQATGVTTVTLDRLWLTPLGGGP